MHTKVHKCSTTSKTFLQLFDRDEKLLVLEVGDKIKIRTGRLDIAEGLKSLSDLCGLEFGTSKDTATVTLGANQ